jgi:hypothetical protein
VAIRVVKLPTCVPPGTIPAPGGSVTVTFTAHSTKPTFLVMICRIREGFPYVFDPDNQTDPDIRVSDIEPVSVAQTVFRFRLTLRRTAKTPEVLQVQLDLAIQETDGGGEPTSSAPLTFPVFVTIDLT